MVGISSFSQFTIHNSQQVCDLLVAIFQTSPFFRFNPKCGFPGNPGSRNDLKKGILAILCHVTFQPGHVSELWTWSGNVCSEAGRSWIRLGIFGPTDGWNMAGCVFFGGQTNKWPVEIYLYGSDLTKGRVVSTNVFAPGTASWAIWKFWFAHFLMAEAEDLFSSIKSSHWT